MIQNKQEQKPISIQEAVKHLIDRKGVIQLDVENAALIKQIQHLTMPMRGQTGTGYDRTYMYLGKDFLWHFTFTLEDRPVIKLSSISEQPIKDTSLNKEESLFDLVMTKQITPSKSEVKDSREKLSLDESFEAFMNGENQRTAYEFYRFLSYQSLSSTTVKEEEKIEEAAEKYATENWTEKLRPTAKASFIAGKRQSNTSSSELLREAVVMLHDSFMLIECCTPAPSDTNGSYTKIEKRKNEIQKQIPEFLSKLPK